MEAFNATGLGKNNTFCGISDFRNTLFGTNHFRKIISLNGRSRHGFSSRRTLSWSSPTYAGKNLQLSTRFVRTPKRQNSLRKKLLDEGKVRHDPGSSNSYNNLDNLNRLPDEVAKIVGSSANENFIDADTDDVQNSRVENPNLLGDSVLWSELENWADQYRADSAFWGVGSGPIFTVYQDSYGNIHKVSVNKDEILRRSGFEPSAFELPEVGDDCDASKKISHANLLAKEIESGDYKLPKNSSIATFVAQGNQTSITDGLHVAAPFYGNMLAKLPWIGFATLCGCFVFLVAKKLLFAGNTTLALTREEEEMLRRKLRSRAEKSSVKAGNIEVVGNDFAPKVPLEPLKRPQLDKGELMNSISKAKESSISKTVAMNKNLIKHDLSDDFATRESLSAKIAEIQEMARHARKLEHQELSKLHEEREEIDRKSTTHAFKEKKNALGSFFNEKIDSGMTTSESNSAANVHSSMEPGVAPCNNDAANAATLNCTKEGVMQNLLISSDAKNSVSPCRIGASNVETLKNNLNVAQGPHEKNFDRTLPSVANEEIRSLGIPVVASSSANKRLLGAMPKIITSVQEAKNYLSQKGGLKHQTSPHFRSLENDKKSNEKEDKVAEEKDETFIASKFVKEFDQTSVMAVSEDSAFAKKNSDESGSLLVPNLVNDEPIDEKEQVGNEAFEGKSDKELHSDVSIALESSVLAKELPDESGPPFDLSMAGSYDSLRERSSTDALTIQQEGGDLQPANSSKGWVEENFLDFEPTIKKIKVGFQKNYMEAKEKVQEQPDFNVDFNQLGFMDNDELQWMEDDSLRKIVLKVRENELAGRDPFHAMDAEDKNSFFMGLEKKAEKVNEKLQGLHQWIHSNIENLDYGSDGISLYDGPEKIIPRWKGPTLSGGQEFLNSSVDKKKVGSSNRTNQEGVDSIPNLKGSTSCPMPLPHEVQNVRKMPNGVDLQEPKTVIESSDGSVRPGKKSGKEHWQHTKKWTREFLEVYNAETDPEIKSIMKGMGKNLDRWITEKEVKEAANLVTRLPERKRKYIEKKMDKLKRELQLFGPQAVVSKYREYSDEKEEDYLWWLDLPYILCIELYIKEDDVQKVGFYSLEMAADLELDPKQHHVVAFENPGDSRSFCYILQAHMEMLGNGCAFVVARHPKDAFREAKANGFSVTVIRKGQIQLNVDQTLEEVENEIAEIGGKFYHDKIMREHGVDMSGLMKGIFRSERTSKRRTRRSKRMLTRPTKL